MRSSSIAKRAQSIRNDALLICPNQTLSMDELIYKKKCEDDFYFFASQAWKEVEPADIFVDGWHMQAYCDHFEDVYRGKIHNLIANMPFRMGKSLIGSVMFPTWVWMKAPEQSFLCISYGEELAHKLHAKCIKLLNSPWFKKYWGSKIKIGDKCSASDLELTLGGSRMARCIGGGDLGFGGHYQIIDDPDNSKAVNSAVYRSSVQYTMDYLLPSRYRGRLEDRKRILIQQRLHYYDSTGHIKENPHNKWVHFYLPEEFEINRRCETVPLTKMRTSLKGSSVWMDPRSSEGELLWPAGRDMEAINDIKQADYRNDVATIRAQLQQDPMPGASGILDPDWFRLWKDPYQPEFIFILQSWDTAMTNNKFSASNCCTTWGVFEDEKEVKRIMLLGVWSQKAEYPELRKKALELYDEFQPNMVVVESQVNGYSFRQDLNSLNVPAVGFKPKKYQSKEQRCRIVSGFIEAGFVYVPTISSHSSTPISFAQKLLAAARIFPNPSPGSDTADLIDSMSQALIKLIELGQLTNRPKRLDLENEYNMMLSTY